MFPRWAAAVAAILLTALPAAPPSRAQGADRMAKPAPLRVFINAMTMLDLAGDIHTVIIANPQIADASVLGPRKLTLLGKKPGQTSLTVLDAGGGTLLTVTVMVTPPDQGVVTVDRGGAATADHGIRESTLACSPRCEVIDEAKSGTEASGAPPALPPAPPAASPPGETPTGQAPRLKSPGLEFNP